MPYFFLGIRYMLLANNRTQKQRQKAPSLFLKAKKSFKSRIKNVTQCNFRNKKTYYFEGNFAY